MPKFTYTGTTVQGEAVKETVTAEDRYAVYDVARKAGHQIEEIKEQSGLSLASWVNVEKVNYFLNRISQDELVMMTRNLSSMLDAGLTFTRALGVIERQSTNPRMEQTVKVIQERVNQGEQVHEALKQFPETFDDLFVAMIRAGEEGGNLSQSLHTLSEQMERSANLKKRIKGAMIYPAIVISVMIGIGFLMMIYVMPTITNIFSDENIELPATTQALIATSDFVNDYTLLTVGGFLAFVISIIYFLRTRLGRRISSWTVVRIPVIGTMAKETNAARTARTMASLLHSGVDVIRSIEITEEVVQNVYYKKILRTARDRVETGTPLSETFVERSDLYPVLVGEMILVGEETGQISDMLLELAHFYEEEVERKTKDLSTIIEPILMVCIGAGVGFFALALMGPIYSIQDTIV